MIEQLHVNDEEVT